MSAATAEVLADGTADASALVAALERAGERAALVSAADLPGAASPAGRPIFAVVRHHAGLADVIRTVPAHRRADLVLLGRSSGLLLHSLDAMLTPAQQGRVTLVAVAPEALGGPAPARPAVVRGQHAELARALLAELGLACEPGAGAEAVEVRLCSELLDLSALWLVCAASGLRTPAAVRDDPAWHAELLGLVDEELLPAVRRLATGKAALKSLQSAEVVVARMLADAEPGGAVAPAAAATWSLSEARRAWSERNGLLLGTEAEADRAAQPRHRWLHTLAGQFDLAEPSDAPPANADADDDAAAAPVAAGDVFAAWPGAASAPFARTVVLVLDVSADSGVNALILNRPTPLTVGELAGETGRFKAFGTNLLHAGGEFGLSDSTPADVIPMYWLHDCGWLPEARELSSHACVGGDSEMLAAAVGAGSLDPSKVRFFWKHAAFRAGVFEAELRDGAWRRLPPQAWQTVC